MGRCLLINKLLPKLTIIDGGNYSTSEINAVQYMEMMWY